jgi:hypothetical protein
MRDCQEYRHDSYEGAEMSRTARGKVMISVGAAVLLGIAVSAASASATIVYNPSSLKFAKQKVGKTSPIQQVNLGGGSCSEGFMNGVFVHNCTPDVSDIAVSGNFVITSNTCPANLIPPGALGGPVVSCSIGVAFKPTGLGPRNGFLRLQSSPSIVGIPLSGPGCKKKKGKKKLVCKTGRKK